MGSGQFQECDESEKTNKPSSKTPQKSGRTESNNITLDNCQILKLPTLPTHSSNIPTKVYGHGVERAEVVLQSPGDFLKEILNTHDGICLGDGEHNKTLFQSLANDLPQLKEAGLKNIFIEVSIDEQKNINNYLKTGDLSFLAIFPDDVNQYGAQLSSSSYSKSFFQKCREMGIDVTCMDVSNERIDALIKKYKNLGVGGQYLQQDAFRNRSDDVSNEQTEKELYEFIEARYAHNEDWVNVISEKLSQSEKGKFLIIGGNGHFLKKLQGKERISIQDQLKETGRSTALIELKLTKAIEPFILKNETDANLKSNLADYIVSYPQQHHNPAPIWAKILLTDDLNAHTINHQEYQRKLKIITSASEELYKSVLAIDGLALTPNNPIWQTLPKDYPFKSEKYLDQAYDIEGLHNKLKVQLKGEKYDYLTIIKMIEQLNVSIKDYSKSINLRDYHEAHLKESGDNLSTKESVALESHIYSIMSTDLSDASISAHTLLSIKRSYAEKGQGDMRDIIYNGLNAAKSIFVLPGSTIWDQLPENHPVKSKENVEISKQIQASIIPLFTQMSFLDYQEVEAIMQKCEKLKDSYAGGPDALLEFSNSSGSNRAPENYLYNMLDAYPQFKEARFAASKLLSINEAFDKKHNALKPLVP